MPNRESARKRVRQDSVRRARNRPVKSKARTVAKRVAAAAQTGDAAQAEKNLREAYATLDKAAKHKVMHRNKAARKKSQLARLVARMGQASGPADSAGA